MSSLDVDELLFTYLAVAPHAVSFVLIRLDSRIQWPVYYMSKSLHEAKVRYLLLEICDKSKNSNFVCIRLT